MAAKKPGPTEESIKDLLSEVLEAGITSTIRLIRLPIKFYVRSLNAAIGLVEEALDEAFPDKPAK